MDGTVGITLAKLLSPIINTATEVAPPGHPMALDAVKNTMELRNGKEIVAINAATLGFGLNLKSSPFEKGRENIYTYHIIVNHNAANAGIIASLTIFSLEGVKPICRILASPRTTAIEFISIPVINAKCGGLSKPSTPKASCQRKSDGPAANDTIDPIIRSLNPVANDILLISLFLISTNPPIPGS